MFTDERKSAFDESVVMTRATLAAASMARFRQFIFFIRSYCVYWFCSLVCFYSIELKFLENRHAFGVIHDARNYQHHAGEADAEFLQRRAARDRTGPGSL